MSYKPMRDGSSMGIGFILSLLTTIASAFGGELLASTRLVPGNEAIPSLAVTCGAPPNALIVMLGMNAAWTTHATHPVIRIQDQDILTIHRASNEVTIGLLRLYDDRNEIVAKIENGEVWISPTIRRKYDGTSLTVFDHRDSEILHVKFINPRTLEISGVFRHPLVASPVVVTPESLDMGGMHFIGNCIGETGEADINYAEH